MSPVPCHPRVHRAGGVTLAGIALLARHCKQLQCVKIALADVDQAAIDKAREHEAALVDSDTAECTLFQIEIGRPVIAQEHVAEVAGVLSACFPRLYQLTSDWLGPWAVGQVALEAHERSEELEMNMRWGKVSLFAHALTLVRRQERRWRALY